MAPTFWQNYVHLVTGLKHPHISETTLQLLLNDFIRNKSAVLPHTQPANTCSKLTIETLEQGVKYVQS